ncbi:hypothetical protein [Blastococcus montanus]|uniref:hypothetical protein n=1 Tax=Blastococcus montanus TaxID=3144973 RepID=UPI003208EE63
MPRRSLTHPFAAATVAAALSLTACGVGENLNDESANPAQEPGLEVDGGNAGPEEFVTEDVSVVDVELPYPSDEIYSTGEDAPLTFTLTNSGSEPVALEEITGDDFAEAVFLSPSGEEMTASAVEVDGNDNLYVGAMDMPTVLLTDLDRDLRSSQSIPVTFSFANGQEVTIEAMVAAEPTGGVGGDVPEPDEDPSPDN